jgi:hypothetical protein
MKIGREVKEASLTVIEQELMDAVAGPVEPDRCIRTSISLCMRMTSFSNPDVLRFMSKRVSKQGTTFGRHELPVSSDVKGRPNGVRIKHRLGANPIKLYEPAVKPDLTW